MGMLIDGTWHDDADRTMVSGTYQRETSALPSELGDQILKALADETGRFYLIASASCPWSHGAVLALVLCQLEATVNVQWAGGARGQCYGLLRGGPLPNRSQGQHLHQFYTATVPDYTGRATVPVLWDAKQNRILSNSSDDIITAFDTAGSGVNLRPAKLLDQIETLTRDIFDGLSNAVYRAGKSERQDAYDEAVDTVFATLDTLEARLTGQTFLFGQELTQADIRLFATLVRFDTVYATHFRCTRRRLVDYPHMWRFTRQIYQMPGIKQTVDFDEIRFGYYVNDGSHNPFDIIGQQPDIDWENRAGIKA